MVLELQRADRVSNSLDGILVAVGEVVHRVDAPRVPGAEVMSVQNPVEHRIAHVDVRVVHVDFRTENARSVLKHAVLHLLEEREVLLDGTVPVGGLDAGGRQRAPRLPDLVGRLMVHVGLPRVNQFQRPLVKLLKVVRREAERVPAEPEPLDVAHDGLDVLRLLLGRIRVVETQVALAAELLGQPEVQADRLRVPDVKVAVGLRGKAGVHFLDDAVLQIVHDDLFDEMWAFAGLSLHRSENAPLY